MAKKLSEQQELAIWALEKDGQLSRSGFYTRGIRMTTVRSLIRKGLVVKAESRVGDPVTRYTLSSSLSRSG